MSLDISERDPQPPFSTMYLSHRRQSNDCDDYSDETQYIRIEFEHPLISIGTAAMSFHFESSPEQYKQVSKGSRYD